jgi:hypothetical protein
MAVSIDFYMQYPSRNGIPISPSELDLPITRLPLDDEKSFNNHHGFFPRVAYMHSKGDKDVKFLFQLLRNLECHQYRLPIDYHEALHKKYEPPKMPTPKQAYEEIQRVYHEGNGMLHIRQQGKYRDLKIGQEIIEVVERSIQISRISVSFRTKQGDSIDYLSE